MENFKSTKINELISAVVKTITEIDGVGKNMEIGEGKNKYNGVSDKDVKDKVGKKMAENGLCLLPIDVEEITDIKQWEDQYHNQKQRVLTRVKVRYLLSHASDQWVILTGIGHGIDSQDKAAGKATTYAMKYTMLYSFAVATGAIDDADTNHSDNMEIPLSTEPEGKTSEKTPEAPKKEIIDTKCDKLALMVNSLKYGELDKKGKRITVEVLCRVYDITPSAKKILEEAENEYLTLNK